MDARIKIVKPGIILTLDIEVDDDIIIARLFVIARTAVNKATCTNAEIYWFSVSDMERDIKQYLAQMMTGYEIDESHIKRTRNGNETEKQVWRILCQILGIQGPA